MTGEDKPRSLTLRLRGVGSVELRGNSVAASGTEPFISRITLLRKTHGENPKNWPTPLGSEPSDLLLKEFLLRLRGEWKEVHTPDELCHCRHVPTSLVAEAIRAGAADSQVVSRWTGASTACGTCRPLVEEMLEYIKAS